MTKLVSARIPEEMYKKLEKERKRILIKRDTLKSISDLLRGALEAKYSKKRGSK